MCVRMCVCKNHIYLNLIKWSGRIYIRLEGKTHIKLHQTCGEGQEKREIKNKKKIIYGKQIKFTHNMFTDSLFYILYVHVYSMRNG